MACMELIQSRMSWALRTSLHSLPCIVSRALLSGVVDTGFRRFHDQGLDKPLLNGAGNSENDRYDVVIVGGGMVGAAVGCGLASSPLTRSLRVAVVDGNPATKRNHTPPKDAVPDSRVSAVTPATVRFLEEVGAWGAVLESRPSSFDSMQVWDYSGKGFTRYEAADVGQDFLGYVVENTVLISSLSSALQRSQFAEIICPAQVKGVQFSAKTSSSVDTSPITHVRERSTSDAAVPTFSGGIETGQFGSGSVSEQDNWAQVLLDDGRVLRTRLVVGADGGKSRVRTLAGIETTGWDYHQQALICTVRVGYQHSTAWQRFLPTGPLALLPMGGEYSNIVWSTTPENAKELKTMSKEEFVLAANRALTEDYGPLPSSPFVGTLSKWFTPLLGDLPPSAREPFRVPPPVKECLTERQSFPLCLKHANKYVSTRLALVGDAAHTVHPLAGQGVNLGFGDAASLVKILGEGIKRGADIGELALLEMYEKEQRWANVPMMAVLDGFQRVFSADFLPVNLARAAGFSLANYFGPLKKRIITFAMGGPS